MGKYVERGRKPPHIIEEGDPLAVALIKYEHQMFRALFDFIEEADGRRLVSLTSEVCVRLAIHMIIEEEILYPELKPVIGVDEVDEGIVEHQVAQRLIADIAAMTGEEELYKSKVHVLGEETMHHIDEEDRGLLRDARTAWEQGKIDLVVLGQQMGERRQELYNDVAANTHRPEPEMEFVGDDVIEEMPNPAAPQPADAGRG